MGNLASIITKMSNEIWHHHLNMSEKKVGKQNEKN